VGFLKRVEGGVEESRERYGTLESPRWSHVEALERPLGGHEDRVSLT
jgi:hypothetical protein